ncbi:LemA family protein [Methylobacillus methanolivorans]|uniref:LemA family protein n=1 Tax=Methylobacillus methanolivorans TaxID=1848927 RepID=A0ABW8GM18_9PROT
MQIFLLVVLVVAVVYFIMVYNGLVVLKNNVEKAWANIDVLLKQRHDELPKLVDTCKQYMQHEQDTLQKVIQARSRVAEARELHDVVALGAAESALRSGLEALFAVAESYPELKANEQFLHLQARISSLENAIADRREFYNDSVNLHNVRIAQFPDLLVARPLGFQRQALLRFAKSELQDVDIAKRFNQ